MADLSENGFGKDLYRSVQVPTEDTSSATIGSSISDSMASPLLQSGSLDEPIFSKKTSFTDSQNGWRQGIDTDGVFKWIIGTSTAGADFGVTTAGTFTVNGAITALSGFFGVSPNGVQVDTNGLTIMGTGYIRTASSGERVQMERNVGSSFHSLLFYNSANVIKMRLSTNGLFQNRASGDSNVGADIQGAGTGSFFSATVSGSDARTSDAGYLFVNSATHGDGLLMSNSSASWDGNFINQKPTGKSFNTYSYWLQSGLMGVTAIPYESKITMDGVMSFPAYSHRSEFDETPAALASTVIAKSYWTGGGTSGTQVIAAEGLEFGSDEWTYMLLSTTATGSRSSTLTFNRSTQACFSRSRWEAMIGVNSRTNTRWEAGWRLDASNYAVFMFDSALSATNIYFETNLAGVTVTTQISTVSNVDFFNRYTIQMYNSKVYAYIDDVLLNSIVSGFNFTGVMKPYFSINNKAAAQEKIMRIDYVDIAHGRQLATS